MKPLYMPIFMIVDASVFEFREFNRKILVRNMKPVYMPIFMIVDASVFEFREFNRKIRRRSRRI